MGLLNSRKSMLLACAALCATNTAFAQETSEDTTKVEKSGRVTLLQRLVVGAGEEKVAIDTPQAVTVLNQEDMDREQASTIADFFASIPGVTAIGSERVAGQAFNIRGIGSAAAADESKILINVDGTTKFFEQYRVGSFFSEPELYKAVEVLRGPASSTLYGAGALGGTINLTTKDASDFLEPGQSTAVRLKSSYDSNGNGFLGSVIWAQRLSGTTDFLFSGNYRSSDKISSPTGALLSGSDFASWSGLAKVTHRFADNDEEVMRLTYQQWNSDADNTDYSQTGTLSFGTVDRDISDKTATFTYENPFSDNPWLDLKFSLAYSDTTVRQENASMPPASSALFLPATYAYRTWSARLENTMDYSGDSFENHLTTGIQFSHQRRIADTDNGSDLSFHPQGTDTEVGLYVQDEFVWNDRLTIIPGIRGDFIWQVPDSSIANATNVNAVALSPKIAAHYKFNDNFAIFGSVAHTERMPTLDELYSWNVANSSYPGGRSPSLSLEKEQSNNFEIGFSVAGQDLLQSGDSLQLKTTAFNNSLTNMISTNPNTGKSSAVPYYVNIGKAVIRGVEVEAAYDSDYVFASASWSVMEGRDTEKHTALTTIPANAVNTTFGGRLPDRGLEFGWKSTFTAPIQTGATTGPFKAYALHGIFASWKPTEGELKGLEFRASVDNLFNVKYQNNLSGDVGTGRAFKVSVAKLIGW